METIKRFFAHKSVRIIIWVIFVLFVAYLIFVIVRVFQMFGEDRTNAQIEKIHNTRLTLDDALGKNLPPDPEREADKTVAGVDVNKNGIRDDVELAIFKTYPNSEKTRAALLQYALALQMEFVQPFINTSIATEVVREQSRGFSCVGKVVPDSYEKLDSLIKFVKDKQFNTKERLTSRDNFLKEVRSYSDLGQICDVNI